MLVMPRPNNSTYCRVLRAAFEKARERQGVEGLSPLGARLGERAVDLPTKTFRATIEELGKDAEFDANFTAWLKANSVWIPLRVFLDTKAEDLAKAGFPPRRPKRS